MSRLWLKTRGGRFVRTEITVELLGPDKARETSDPDRGVP